MNSLIESQFKFANLMAIGQVSAQGETKSGDSQRESPKASEIAMYIEMGIALAVAFGLLAIAAWVWYSANPDWMSSIRRLQEMI